jgi:hypothetical protein
MAVTGGSGGRRRRVFVAMGLTIFALFAATTARLFVFPDLSPLPDRVDAVIALGGPGERDSVAVELARKHHAPLVLRSTAAIEGAVERCLPPVPEVTIVCFHPEPSTTRGEAQYIGRLAAQHQWKSVILVTTPDHAWRAALRVSRCFDGDVYVSTTPLPTLAWFGAIPYQWAASAKALTVERDC